VGEGEPSGAAAEVIAWTDRLRVHLVDLERYFSDWQERPEALDRFSLAEYPLSFRGYQGVKHDDLIGMLNEHKRLLLVEAEKQLVPLPQTLPDLLRQARTKLGLSQREAAGEVGVSADTYKGWEQARAFPRGMNHLQIRQFLDRGREPRLGSAPSSGDPV
jgi:DNA-binding transcriptional regulator YiaG